MEGPVSPTAPFLFIIADYNVPFIFVTPKTNVNSSFFFYIKLRCHFFIPKLLYHHASLILLTMIERKGRKQVQLIACRDGTWLH